MLLLPSELAVRNLVIGAGTGHHTKPTIGPQLALGTKPVRGLQNTQQFVWPDSGGRIVGYFADPAPVSYQAPVVDLLWAWCGDQFQRRSRGCERPTPTEEEACGDSRTKRELQSRSEESVQGGGRRGFDQARPVGGVLRSPGGQRHAAGDGTTYLGQEDCHDCFDRVEERSVLRRPSFETTNSLSVSDRIHSILGIFSGGGRAVLETLWFESESQLVS